MYKINIVDIHVHVLCDLIFEKKLFLQKSIVICLYSAIFYWKPTKFSV